MYSSTKWMQMYSEAKKKELFETSLGELIRSERMTPVGKNLVLPSRRGRQELQQLLLD